MPKGKHNNHFTGNRNNTKLANLTCLFCKNNFYKKESELRVRKTIPFCSRECWRQSNKKIVTSKCKNCGNITKEERNEFCSKPCWLKYKINNKLSVKSGFWYESGYKVLYQYGIKQGKKEHIKIIEDHIGRKLMKNEHVHHKNGNKLDNRLKNLQLLTNGEHSRIHRLKEIKSGKNLFGRS